MTTRPGEATSLAVAALAAGHRNLGAFGGDGTLHEVVQAILAGGYDDASVTYLPAGSSCDFAKNFPGRDPLSIDGREPRLVDVIRVDCHNEDGSPLVRYAANYASVGLMADATARFNRAQGLTGLARRMSVDAGAIVAVIAALIALQPVACTLAVDDAPPYAESLLNLTLFKTPWVGGGMHFNAPIMPDDGIMMTAALRPKSKRALFGIIPALYRGTVLARPDVWSRACRSLTLTTALPVVVEADGELIGRSPVSFRLLRKALRVMV
jgi:diacylglycerol kinase family enzyme